MFVNVKKYAQGYLSVKFAYSAKNVEKIRKVNGRKWIESDKIWVIPDNKESVNLLYRLFGAENIISDVFEFDKNTIMVLKNELKLRNYSVRTQKAYLGPCKKIFTVL